MSEQTPIESSPEWFNRALDAQREDGWSVVDDCRIHYATWGEIGKPGIVLVHGSNAHLEWWRFVAPFLADHFRVAAIDLSGNGDSGWREKYSGESFAKEVKAVCDDAQLGDNPFVVAHSFGGFVALETGHYFGKELGGIIFADFTVSPPEDHTEWGKNAEETGEKARPTRVYDNYETAVGRFRYVPEQPNRYPEVLRYLATQSLHQVEGGWTWKFDPALFDHLVMGVDQRDKFVTLECRSAVVLGEHSTDEGALAGDYMSEITNSILPVFYIPATHHHFMFDEPMATVAVIKGIILTWIAEDRRTEMTRALADVSII
jgi:pimeloyl-ACP methyl ester carboxylesterase